MTVNIKMESCNLGQISKHWKIQCHSQPAFLKLWMLPSHQQIANLLLYCILLIDFA